MDLILGLIQGLVYIALFLAIVVGALMVNPMLGIIAFLFGIAVILEELKF